MLAKSSHLRSNHLRSNYKVFFFLQSTNLSLNELKLIAKGKGIKDYKSMSEHILLMSLNESELVKESEKNFDDARIEKIKKDF